MENVKEKILEAQNFNSQELELYKKLLSNFDCSFRQIYEKVSLGGYLKDSLVLELNVELNSKAKTIDDVASQLENAGIELGNLEDKKDGKYENVEGNFERRFYEKADITGDSFEHKGEFKNYSYNFFPKDFEVHSKITINIKD